MAHEDAIKLEGAVVEVLPNTMYRVELSNGHRVLAHVPGRMRRDFTGFFPGDKVTLEMSPYDLSKGCIMLEKKQIQV